MPERSLIAHYLAELREALRFPPPLQERILSEVEEHLWEGACAEEARGIAAELAQRRAIARFGAPELVAEWFAAEYPANVSATPLVSHQVAAECAAKGGRTMWQRFTERARRVVFFAQEEAARCGTSLVDTEHLLLGLTREHDSVAGQMFTRMGAPPGVVMAKVVPHLSQGDGTVGQDMQLTPASKKAIDEAYEESLSKGDNYIGTEHLLAGLIREGEGLAARVLGELGVTLDRTREATQIVLRERAAGKPDPISVAWRLVEEARQRLREAEAVYDALLAAAAQSTGESQAPGAPPPPAPDDTTATGEAGGLASADDGGAGGEAQGPPKSAS